MQKLIWVKMPKAAGTSLKSFIREKELPESKIIMAQPEELEVFQYKNNKEWNEAFKFAIIRNPFDKIISAWKYLKQTRDLPLKTVLKDLPHRFDDKIGSIHMTLSQTKLLSDANGRIDFNKLVRFENLDRDLQEVFDLIGVDVSLGRYNVSIGREKDYRKYYDDESRELVEKMFWMDLKLFDYKF